MSRYQALAIIGSTGATEVVLKIFSALQDHHFTVPIFLTQHMVGSFIKEFCANLQRMSGKKAYLTNDDEVVRNNAIYVAPGGYHLGVIRDSGKVKTKLLNGPPENFCKPAADPMLRALAEVYGRHLLVVVLTGIGNDGTKGCQEVVENGGTVIAQNEKSCAVYGMPKSVVDNNLATQVLNIEEIIEYLKGAL